MSEAAVQLKYARIVARSFGCDVTLPEGLLLSCSPQPGSDYTNMGLTGHTDPIKYVRERALVYAYLTEKMFDAPSELLLSAAHTDWACAIRAHVWETKVVFYFQRFMHNRARSPDPNWIVWKIEALEHTRALRGLK